MDANIVSLVMIAAREGRDDDALTLIHEHPGLIYAKERSGKLHPHPLLSRSPTCRTVRTHGILYVLAGGWTPLLHASKAGFKAVVRALLELGANVNDPNEYHASPLCWASCGYVHLDACVCFACVWGKPRLPHSTRKVTLHHNQLVVRASLAHTTRTHTLPLCARPV